MAVTACNYIQDGEQATADERNRGTYSISFLIETDALTHGPQTVLNLALSGTPNPVPALWATYSFLDDTNTASYARDYTIRRHPRKREWWIATVGFRPLAPGEQAGIENTTPTLRPAVFHYEREVFSEQVEVDAEGNPFENACQRPFPIDVELEKTRSVLVVKHNVSTEQEADDLVEKFQNTVNKDEWTASFNGVTYKKRSLCCREVVPQPEHNEAGTTYFPVVFRFAVGEPLHPDVQLAFPDAAPWDVPKVENGAW